jgi:hypothetical protein
MDQCRQKDLARALLLSHAPSEQHHSGASYRGNDRRHQSATERK